MKQKSKKDLKKYFIINNYIDRVIRIFIDPKYQREGDIHVFPDDHIEWSQIRKELTNHQVTIIEETDYLLYRRNYNQTVYESWKKKIGDMHILLGKKQ